MRVRHFLILISFLGGLVSGCKSQDTVTNNYPVQLVRPGQTRQLYAGYVQYPTPSLTPDSDESGIYFSLLGYGAIPYVIANGSTYIFPLSVNFGSPTVTVEKGVVAGKRITIDQTATKVALVPEVDTQYPLSGITYWRIRISSTQLAADWAKPVLHIVYDDVYANDNTPYTDELYYPLGR